MNIQEINQKAINLMPGEGFEVKSLSNKDYHSIDCLGISASRLKYLALSKEHFEQSMIDKLDEDGDESSEALVFGSVLHTLILEPQKAKERFFVGQKFDRRTTVGKADHAKQEEDFLELSQKAPDDFHLINQEILDLATTMANKAKGHPTLAAIIKHPDTVFESSFFYKHTDPAFQDIVLKAKPDFYNKTLGLIGDLKSTRKYAHKNSFRRTIVEYRYEVQGSIIVDAVKSVHGGEAMNFLVVPIEKKAPHGMAVFNLIEPCLDVGRSIAKNNLANWNAPERSYPVEIQPIDIAAYGFDVESRI